jgi:hypothetical protein
MGRRTQVLLAATLVVTTNVAAPARATPNRSPIYTSSTLCAFEGADIEAGPAGEGRAVADIYGAKNHGSEPCVDQGARDPGYLAQQIFVYYRNPDTNEEGLCAITDWYYNEGKYYHFGIYVESLASLCGTGFYRTTAVGAVGIDNNWIQAHPNSDWQEFREPAG